MAYCKWCKAIEAFPNAPDETFNYGNKARRGKGMKPKREKTNASHKS